MRRDDREVTSVEGIFDILSRCDTMHLAMNDEGSPYVIPMTFGCEMENGSIVVYFHSAAAGHKYELLAKDPRVTVEASLYYQVKRTDDGAVTARYESVIGRGTAELLTEQADKVAALKCMLAHYKESGFPVTSCKGLAQVAAFRVRLDTVTGKHNL